MASEAGVGVRELVHMKSEAEKTDESGMTPEEVLAARLARCRQELDLQWILLTPPLVGHLARALNTAAAAPCGASPLTTLTTVYLGGCELGDDGASKVMDALHGCCPRSIQSIDLMFNQLTERGVAAVVDAFVRWGPNSPTFLGLSWNDFGDAGVRVLLPLLSAVSPTALHTLSLSNCLITQQGGALMAEELANSVHMRQLILTGNPGIQGTVLTHIQKIVAQERIDTPSP